MINSQEGTKDPDSSVAPAVEQIFDSMAVEQVPLKTGYRDAVVKAAARDPASEPPTPLLVRAAVNGLPKYPTTATAPDCQSVSTSVVTHHEIESIQSWAEDDDCFYQSVIACESSEGYSQQQVSFSQQQQGGRAKEGGGWKNVQSKGQQGSSNSSNSTSNQPSRGERRRRPPSSSASGPAGQSAHASQAHHSAAASTTGGRFDALAPQSSKSRGGWR